MPVGNTPTWMSRRRFLAAAGAAVGVSGHAVAGLHSPTARATPPGRIVPVAAPAPVAVWAPLVPGDVLVSVNHTKPLLSADIAALTATLQRLLPAGLQIVLPPTLQGDLNQRFSVLQGGATVNRVPPTARGRGARSSWTFRSRSNGQLYHTVIRYGLKGPGSSPSAAMGDALRAAQAITTAIDTAFLTAKQPLPVAGTGITVNSATPNWTSSSEPSGWIVGGPGGPPAVEAQPNQLGRWHYEVHAGHRAFLSGAESPRVNVVVLDTSPFDTAAQATMAAASKPLNGLLQALVAGVDAGEMWDDVATVCGTALLDPCGYVATRTTDPLSSSAVPPHYAMPDHGLFVAGVVRDVAAGCTLRVIRVLNEYGVGAVTSLIAALEAVHDLALSQGGSVVVNMSLTLNIPDLAELALVDKSGLLPAAVQYLAPLARQPIKASAPLARVISDLVVGGVLCVAAVGNDSAHLGAHPLDPRVPASYPDVVAVAAVDRLGDKAPYSNRCEALAGPNNGIAVFGGVSSAGPDAVHGLYSHSTSGWARWVGTSFATPVISGLVADGLAAQPSLVVPTAAVAYLQGLARSGVLHPELGCPVIKAEQVWRPD